MLRFSKDYPGQVESKPSLKRNRKYSNPQNQSTERFQMCYHPTGHKTNGSVIHQAAIPCQLSGPCRIRRLLAWHGLCREKPPQRGRLTKPVDVWFEHIGNNLVVGSDGIQFGILLAQKCAIKNQEDYRSNICRDRSFMGGL